MSSSSSSSNSPSSSAVASWYCWYSDTKSFMLDSASVNSISSIPSPVYQWRKALRRNIAVNCSLIRLNNSWMAVVAHKCGSHLETTWWDIAHSCLHVVRDPFNEVGAVLVLDVEHLLVNLLHGHATAEHGCHGEVAAVARVTCCHHVLCIKHLLCAH